MQVWPFYPAVSLDPAIDIPYPFVRTSVRVIVWRMQSEKSGGCLWKKFWLDQGRVEILKIMKIMVWGPFRASFGRNIDVGAVLRTMFLRDMACRDG